jgi:UDPglucose--hexose-1-phosphate uridylyltransferase
MSEMRWNPILEEWVVTSTHRQERTFLPLEDYCPLCPTKPGGFPTEVPASDYEIVVFENKFPAFRREPPSPAVSGSDLCPVRPSQGICEVVLYSPRHDATLTDMSVAEIRRLIAVWADRTAELGALDYIHYVYVFENKGAVIGVTLTHPHGQIYAFPDIPPIIQRELAAAHKHRQRTGRCLFCDVLAQERADGRRIVLENNSFTAFVPFYARWPYETHVYARAHHLSLLDLDDGERLNLARLLKALLTRFDALWGLSLPYMMALHQAPTDGQDYSHYHFHIEFYPPYRTRDKLKYLASVESGAGTFLNDTLPEGTAAALRGEPRETLAKAPEPAPG